jgi:hypothetical protein
MAIGAAIHILAAVALGPFVGVFPPWRPDL